MKKFGFSILLATAGAVAFSTALKAQDGGGSSIEPAKPAKWREVTDWKKHPRLEDHFWRKKVRYRIDFNEKINKPFRESEPVNLYDSTSRQYNANKDRYEYYKGIIPALLDAYANGFMVGYSPDTLDDIMEFNEFRAKYKKNTDIGGTEPTEGGDDADTGDDEDWDTSNDDDSPSAGAKGASPGGDAAPRGEDLGNDFSGMSRYMDIIEDRIFDKNKSDMFYEPEYIILSCKGPVSEIPLVAFRYEDVKDTVLGKCLWKNRFNDAEYRTMKEIMELRLFNSFLTVVGLGQDYAISDIYDSEKKRLQMIDYEHNLFEF
jgi:hypothetical protein